MDEFPTPPTDQAAEVVHGALERLDWLDKRAGQGAPGFSLTRRRALTGGAAGLAALLLSACDESARAKQAAAPPNPVKTIFGVRGGYRFTFVNHMVDSLFFVPTIAGVADACALLDCSYEWTGSAHSATAQMAMAINAAVSARVDGIATTLLAGDLDLPVKAALRAGVPVVSYNADEPASGRLAYVGQDLLHSGRILAQQIRKLLPHGSKVAVFVATPGLANLAPRLVGMAKGLAGSGVHADIQVSGVSQTQEMKTIGAFISQNMTRYQGYFAVDAGSTAAVAASIASNGLTGRVAGGGFDLLPNTQTLLSKNVIQFSIDQQPYLQGFLPTLELFLHRATYGLTGTADVDTGIHVLDHRTIAPYVHSSSPYEGTSPVAGVQRP
ncbi:MAG: substrate-binding domain-containing protein [Solirubrobacteraceae bacterium]